MDQEDSLDFKALRAKFQEQEEELLLKQPRIKPTLPEKPKMVPPPTSPVHYLPAGARPSLLTSINQSLEAKTLTAPRVVFKDDKKESKKPLILTNTKAKEKSEGKIKVGKDKTRKGSKDKLDEDLPDLPQKKKDLTLKDKKATAELAPAKAPSKTATLKKKAFLGFKKAGKKDSYEVSSDPFLDSLGPGGPTPLPGLFGGTTPDPELGSPRALMPPPLPTFTTPTLPTSPAPPLPTSTLSTFSPPPLPSSPPVAEASLPPSLPASSIITVPPAFVPDVPAPEVLTPDIETPPEIEISTLPFSLLHTPSRTDDIIPSPPSRVPTPPPTIQTPPPTIQTPPPTRVYQSIPTPTPSSPSPSPPPPQFADVEAAAMVESPPRPSSAVEPESNPSSPKLDRPLSAFSALERAEEMGPTRRSAPCDLRVFSALEKARRKISGPSPSSSSSVTPPPEELQAPPSPTQAVQVPPIDYEDKAGKAKPAQVNGFDHRQGSPVLEGIAEEGSDPTPELLVVPPPPPRKSIPMPEALGPAPQKPARPSSVNLSTFRPSSPEVVAPAIPAPLEFSETDAPEFVRLGTDSPVLRGSEWENGEYASPHRPESQSFPESIKLWNDNGSPFPRASGPIFGGAYDDDHQPDSRPVSQDLSAAAGLQSEDEQLVAFEGADNPYEVVGATNTKKREKKNDAGKKRKGPPKNPYAEAAQEVTNEEKTKSGRFGKNDKKAAPEGPDEKELKKKEKQRLEKEKKELKEQKEREKKEQKEREKKESEREKRENEMKKKFKITGQEDTMYQAKVTVTAKGRKDDLPVKSGEIISVIRTTNCPKGKWLARDDSSNTYGYVAVNHVELDIKEMLEMGKKAAIDRKQGDGKDVTDGDAISTGSRASNHYPQSTGSFTDDSEEWTNDDDEPVSSPTDAAAGPLIPLGHIRTNSLPDIGNKELSINHQHSHSDNLEGPHMQARHEALQKLATFFHSPKPVSPRPDTSVALMQEEAVHLPEGIETQEVDVGLPDTLILPPPDLYADIHKE
ncbi:uncharacterized protein LOC143002762 [Genypterus blacodes]|uniref:uncharacterized protein LOC143002762 n=1 Tax=Genypterus blacodes TaxID=154954 RepID=UPI003F774D7D